jgi:hypothetical protein
MMNRRRTLKRVAALAAAPLILPARVWADPPSKRLAHAAIGITGQAASDIDALMGSGRLDVVAIADVDKRNHAATKQKFPNAKIYQDWRELFRNESDKFESVNITVPDHMHALVAMEALRRKKHVYCQKPLTRTIEEARALRSAAREAGVVTQMGNQIQSSSEYRTAVQMVKEGAIGKVKEVHCWSGATFAQSPRPDGEETIPEGLSWDLWLGGAPARPYRNGIYHPFNWRGWQDFGGGAIADFACHIMDTPFKAIGLDSPLSVRCTAAEDSWRNDPKRRADSWPAWEIFEYIFAGTDMTAGKTLPLHWYDGGKKPEASKIPGMENRELPGNGAAIVGEDATLLIVHFGSRPQLLRPGKPPELRKKMEPGSPQEHYTSFVLACLGEGKTTSHFDYAVPLTTAALLGTIAVRFPEKTLSWDEKAGVLSGDPDAAKLVSQPYREGWSLEKI